LGESGQNPPLKAFARARGWFEELAAGRVRSLAEIARREGLAKRYVTRLTKLAFVSPAFAEAIMEGEVPIATNWPAARKPDLVLLKAIARASHWFEELASGRVRSLAEIARREGIGRRYVERLTRLAFLAPGIVEAAAEGRTPAGLTLQSLMASRVGLPLEWNDQERTLAFD
jgi:ParB-like chromosome segregation protein Spo0J